MIKETLKTILGFILWGIFWALLLNTYYQRLGM